METNEEKAMQIAREITNKSIKGKFDNCLKSAMTMAKWKDEQFEQKLYDWVNNGYISITKGSVEDLLKEI